MSKAVSATPENAWKTGILSDLSDAERVQLENSSPVTSYTRNETVFEEGGHPKGIYLLLTGKIKIFAMGNEGKAQIIHIARPGELVGFRAMFSGEAYKVSAAMLEDGTIAFIDKITFQKLIDESRSVRNAVIRELAKELGERALYVTKMAQKTVRARLALAILDLQEVYGDEAINMTREDLANYVGTATESLIRLLKEFKEEGLIQVQARKLTLLNKVRLEELAK